MLALGGVSDLLCAAWQSPAEKHCLSSGLTEGGEQHWENPFEFLQRPALVPVLQLGSIHLVIVRHNCVLSGLHNTPISSIVRPCHYFIHPVP